MWQNIPARGTYSNVRFFQTLINNNYLADLLNLSFHTPIVGDLNGAALTFVNSFVTSSWNISYCSYYSFHTEVSTRSFIRVTNLTSRAACWQEVRFPVVQLALWSVNEVLFVVLVCLFILVLVCWSFDHCRLETKLRTVCTITKLMPWCSSKLHARKKKLRQ